MQSVISPADYPSDADHASPLQNGANGTNGISIDGHANDDTRRFSRTDSIDVNSLSGQRSINEDEEAYLLRISAQNSRQPSLALDRSSSAIPTSAQEGIIAPLYTPITCHHHKFGSSSTHLKQASDTVKSSPIKLMIQFPIGFPQAGHPNLTKEVLSSLKMSLDGVLEKGEKSLDVEWKDVLVVIYVEFGWLETTVELLKKFGAIPKDRESLKVKSNGVNVVAQMFESTIRPGIGNAENLMQVAVLIPHKSNEHPLDSEQWTPSIENDVKPWVSIRVPVRTTVRASMLRAYYKKAKESNSLGYNTEKYTYDVASVRTNSRALKEKVRS